MCIKKPKEHYLKNQSDWGGKREREIGLKGER